MGYTHYLYRPERLDKEKFIAFKDDVVKLKDALPETKKDIKGGYGEGEPNFTSDGIWFNGNAEKNADHETLHIPRNIILNRYKQPDERGLILDFCKTAFKPYDLLVCLTLIAFKHHFKGQVEVSSDGDMRGGDWQEARELYEKILERKVPKQFKEKNNNDNISELPF